MKTLLITAFLSFVTVAPFGAIGYSVQRYFANKKRCISVVSPRTNERCEAIQSSLCVDHLCPAHCKELHGDKCNNLQF